MPLKHGDRILGRGNKSLVEAAWRQTGTPRQTLHEYFELFASIIAQKIIAGKPFGIRYVGRFEFKKRKGRTIIWKNNPMANKTFGVLRVVQKDSIVVKFRVAKALKRRLNAPKDSTKPTL